MRFVEAWRKEVTIRVWQVVGISLALTGTWGLGIYGSWRYFDRQDHAACVERAELRDDVRGAFEVVFAYIETLGVDGEFASGALAVVDARIPAIDSAAC
jgi:hypothetical protein